MNGLEKAREKREAMKAAGLAVERRTPLEKHLANPNSLRLAVNAKCVDCVGAENADNGFRRAIRECGCASCPLYTVRPYQRSESDAEESE